MFYEEGPWFEKLIYGTFYQRNHSWGDSDHVGLLFVHLRVKKTNPSAPTIHWEGAKDFNGLEGK